MQGPAPAPDIAARLGRPVRQCNPVAGGSINSTWQVVLEDGTQLFAKLNSAPNFPQLLSLESAGLNLIAAQQLIRTPQVLDQWQDDARQYLLLEWIEAGPRDELFWERFGRELASLHRVRGTCFGGTADNYMGAVPQSNSAHADWPTFFLHERIEPLLQRCRDAGLLDARRVAQFGRLQQPLEALFPAATPSLLHGDLWSGNFLCATGGIPVLIDPAAYWGERSVDLAMTTLFGGLMNASSAYHEAYPLPPQHRAQWELMNLYPLLVHLLLFGRSYYQAIERTLQRFA